MAHFIVQANLKLGRHRGHITKVIAGETHGEEEYWQSNFHRPDKTERDVTRQ